MFQAEQVSKIAAAVHTACPELVAAIEALIKLLETFGFWKTCHGSETIFTAKMLKNCMYLSSRVDGVYLSYVVL